MLFAQFIKHPAATTLTTNQPNSARVACFIIKSLDTIMLQNGHQKHYIAVEIACRFYLFYLL